jgi:hypothetical protein
MSSTPLETRTQCPSLSTLVQPNLALTEPQQPSDALANSLNQVYAENITIVSFVDYDMPSGNLLNHDDTVFSSSTITDPHHLCMYITKITRELVFFFFFCNTGL